MQEKEGLCPFVLLPRARLPARTAPPRGLSRRGPGRAFPPRGWPVGPGMVRPTLRGQPGAGGDPNPRAEAPQRWRSRKNSPRPLGLAVLPPDFLLPGVLKRAPPHPVGGGSEKVLTFCRGWGVGTLHHLTSASSRDRVAQARSQRRVAGPKAYSKKKKEEKKEKKPYLTAHVRGSIFFLIFDVILLYQVLSQNFLLIDYSE